MLKGVRLMLKRIYGALLGLVDRCNNPPPKIKLGYDIDALKNNPVYRDRQIVSTHCSLPEVE